MSPEEQTELNYWKERCKLYIEKEQNRIKQGCSICSNSFRFEEEVNAGVCAVCVTTVKKEEKTKNLPRNSCNKHDNCDLAKENSPNKYVICCHDECCEDCFGC